eukprot:s639_g6.t1
MPQVQSCGNLGGALLGRGDAPDAWQQGAEFRLRGEKSPRALAGLDLWPGLPAQALDHWGFTRHEASGFTSFPRASALCAWDFRWLLTMVRQPDNWKAPKSTANTVEAHNIYAMTDEEDHGDDKGLSEYDDEWL